MRVPRSAVVVCVVAWLFLAVPASGTNSQSIGGYVWVPTGPRNAGPVLVAACGVSFAMSHWAAGSWAQSVVAHRFDVDPATEGEAFSLRPNLPADLDITFWARSGDVTFASKGGDGEHGIVPAGARWATVCLDSGPPTAFSYTAG